MPSIISTGHCYPVQPFECGLQHGELGDGVFYLRGLGLPLLARLMDLSRAFFKKPVAPAYKDSVSASSLIHLHLFIGNFETSRSL